MVKRKALLFSDFLDGNQRPRWGRSAGPDFSPMRNRAQRQRPCQADKPELGTVETVNPSVSLTALHKSVFP